jgi:transposase
MYPSDLSDKQWTKLEAVLKASAVKRHPGGRPRKHALRRVVEAVLYVVKTGCQWRQLPSDFPPWKSVHEDFRRWRREGVWPRVVKALREEARGALGRSREPTVAIIDSQSVKTALKGGSVVMMPARKSRVASATLRSTHKASCSR